MFWVWDDVPSGFLVPPGLGQPSLGGRSHLVLISRTQAVTEHPKSPQRPPPSDPRQVLRALQQPRRPQTFRSAPTHSPFHPIRSSPNPRWATGLETATSNKAHPPAPAGRGPLPSPPPKPRPSGARDSPPPRHGGFSTRAPASSPRADSRPLRSRTSAQAVHTPHKPRAIAHKPSHATPARVPRGFVRTRAPRASLFTPNSKPKRDTLAPL